MTAQLHLKIYITYIYFSKWNFYTIFQVNYLLRAFFNSTKLVLQINRLTYTYIHIRHIFYRNGLWHHMSVIYLCIQYGIFSSDQRSLMTCNNSLFMRTNGIELPWELQRDKFLQSFHKVVRTFLVLERWAILVTYKDKTYLIRQ